MWERGAPMVLRCRCRVDVPVRCAYVPDRADQDCCVPPSLDHALAGDHHVAPRPSTVALVWILPKEVDPRPDHTVDPHRQPRASRPRPTGPSATTARSIYLTSCINRHTCMSGYVCPSLRTAHPRPARTSPGPPRVGSGSGRESVRRSWPRAWRSSGRIGRTMRETVAWEQSTRSPAAAWSSLWGATSG
jgi:hypothetical protein